MPTSTRLLRLPTGIWYSPGVKANVIFFDKKEGRAEAWTDKLWVYDLRTNQHFTLKQKPIRRSDFDEFVACYKPGRDARAQPKPGAKRIPKAAGAAIDYDEFLKRDKLSLDLFWIKDKSLTDTDALPAPDDHRGGDRGRSRSGAGAIHQDRGPARAHRRARTGGGGMNEIKLSRTTSGQVDELTGTTDTIEKSVQTFFEKNLQVCSAPAFWHPNSPRRTAGGSARLEWTKRLPGDP